MADTESYFDSGLTCSGARYLGFSSPETGLLELALWQRQLV